MRPIRAKDREAKRIPLSLRVTPQNRDAIGQAASNSGRSISQEAELRLERSFEMDDQRAAFEAVSKVIGPMPHEHTLTLLATLRKLIEGVEAHQGCSWKSEDALMEAYQINLRDLMEAAYARMNNRSEVTVSELAYAAGVLERSHRNYKHAREHN